MLGRLHLWDKESTNDRTETIKNSYPDQKVASVGKRGQVGREGNGGGFLHDTVVAAACAATAASQPVPARRASSDHRPLVGCGPQAVSEQEGAVFPPRDQRTAGSAVHCRS